MNDPLFSIEIKQLGGITVVCLDGEIDLSNVHQLENQVHYATDGSPRVAIDLAEVRYLDSQALRLIKQLNDQVQERGGELTILAPPNCFARQVLEVSGMGAVLTIRDEPEG